MSANRPSWNQASESQIVYQYTVKATGRIYKSVGKNWFLDLLYFWHKNETLKYLWYSVNSPA